MGRAPSSDVEVVAAHGPRRGACRSRLRMRERSLSITASFTDSEDEAGPANETSSPKRKLMVKAGRRRALIHFQCSYFVLIQRHRFVKVVQRENKHSYPRHRTAT